jgi:P4 family phage/plasmid primase-like protien
MKVFAKKITALKYLKADSILCNNNIKKYFILKDYVCFKNLIEKDYPLANYYEFIRENAVLKYFLDIEIYQNKDQSSYNKHEDIIKSICKRLEEVFFAEFGVTEIKFIILESHSEEKKSYHIILNLKRDNKSLYFKNVKGFKRFTTNLFLELTSNKIIDISVYREGLFRTYYSTKFGEDRPLIKSHLSDEFDFMDTFICYCPEAYDDNIIDTESKLFKRYKMMGSNENDKNLDNDTETTTTIMDVNDYTNDKLDYTFLPIQKDLTEDDCEIIKNFISKFYKYRLNDIRDIIIDEKLNCIIVALHNRFCYNIDREHKTNHQYIVIDTYSSKQKCHDIDCINFKHDEIKIKDFPKELNEIILKCLRVNKIEQELIQKAIKECKDYITENFDTTIDEIQFDKTEMVFRGDVSENLLMKMSGKCPDCYVEHQISDNGYCLKCKVCKSIFPKNTLIPIADKYKHLNNFFLNYNQLVNNGTVNINIQNNYYGAEEDFSCDIQLDNTIFKNKELTKLYNQVLDGHKVIKLSELLHKLEIDFKYTGGMWYYFNGTIWRLDKESLELRKRILKLSNQFYTIKSHYENQGGDTSNNLVKNIKSLINKLYKPGFEEEVIKGAKMYYNDEAFITNLNSKKHLVPFSNGVYDLLEARFRKTKKDDYINLTVGYNYDERCNNKEVYLFLEQVLPNIEVRNYVLKKMSECLNGDIPNTNFLMFIGDSGANGKSQLLNLMKLAMGEFGEKVEVTLLTRKRNNANEANSEKIKLMYKRFAFLSEPEDGEKINIGLLKELTGSEEIVARGLYQDAVSFVLEAKLFLACNELPEIKGEDTALWRRIRVIDFPSRFVDDPKVNGEYKIDRTLPSRMREDITWRQTFVNILLSYYFKDVKEPLEVQIKTNEYRQENNEFYNWLEENIIYKQGSILKLQDMIEIYLGKKINTRQLGKYRKEIEKYIKDKFKNIDWEYKQFWVGTIKYKGWQNLEIVEKYN